MTTAPSSMASFNGVAFLVMDEAVVDDHGEEDDESCVSSDEHHEGVASDTTYETDTLNTKDL